ncbi:MULTISPECIES: lytic murein transglycosylase [unclassified Dyella]|uniref:lytic murein transglycosylase n=1 Tax=unclassified Dyella TaxID=2634549 RepID=UPI0020330DCF|nr:MULTISPECIES: lytic murein transglycosylase [unclassified Dyella]
MQPDGHAMPASRSAIRFAPLVLALALPAVSFAQAQDDFARCLAGLAPKAVQARVQADTYQRYTRDLVADTTVIDSLNRQPEFVIPVWDYLSALVDQERVDDGKARMQQWSAVLSRAQQTYGVDPATVVAVWGVESNYGQQFGQKPLLQSLATLSCMGRRQEYFRGEFFAALRIVQSGDIGADEFKGSWAGAFGHTQFMPSTFERVAVDFDGDGHRDLIASVPDALGSTAHYLQMSHWQAGQPWGYEVKLPANFDSKINGRTAKRPLSYWSAQGVRLVDGSPLPGGDEPAGLVLPAGAQGPAFLTLRNFDAIYAYNASINYTLAIALLSDRLRGKPGMVASWPTDDPGTSRAERREIQQLLINRGYDIGTVDGMVGDKTRQAIQEEQRKRGLPVDDGRPGQRILKALRQSP